MACHVSHGYRYGNIFSVSNEISPILVTCFLGNKWQNVSKKTFGSPFKNTDKKEKNNKKRKERQLQVFRVTRKCKNSNIIPKLWLLLFPILINQGW